MSRRPKPVLRFTFAEDAVPSHGTGVIVFPLTATGLAYCDDCAWTERGTVREAHTAAEAHRSAR